MAPWPDHWPKYHNACNEPCDILIGPCACGATHTRNEFIVIVDRLYRGNHDRTTYEEVE